MSAAGLEACPTQECLPRKNSLPHKESLDTTGLGRRPRRG